MSDPTHLGTNTFVLRQVRPSLQGIVGKNLEFRIVPDFGSGTVVLQDAYIDWKFNRQFVLRSGKYKSPFGLERLQADTDLTFMLRGLPALLAPNRDLGVQLGGDLSQGRINYAVGIFNGVADGSSADTDQNNDKDFAARIFTTPFSTATRNHPLNGLGLGFAVTTGRQAGIPSVLRSPGQNPIFSYLTGVTADGNRNRYSPQAYYYRGPLGLLAEYIFSGQELRKGTTVYTVSRSAWQVEASYVLTGERKSYKGVMPSKEFLSSSGGWGAWEVAARFGQLSADPEIFKNGLADLSKSARETRQWTAGLNWYLNRNFRFSFNYEDLGFSGGAPGKDCAPERLILSRFQIVY
jgi:phosphate-selective porin OprO/OprP